MTRAVCAAGAAFVLILAGAFSMATAADRGSQGKGMGASTARKGAPLHASSPGFSPRDRVVIGDYFRSVSSRLPPGLGLRNGDLPPGLERQLRKNGRLPKGLEKNIDPFPRELNGRLAPLSRDYTRGLIGGTAVVIDQRTMAIVDIIPNLFDAARR